MNLKTHIFSNKQGSYVVEAAIILPILIVSICSLILIIRIIAACETITFSTASALIDVGFYCDSPISEITLYKKISDCSQEETDISIKKLRFLYSDEDMDDLIELRAEARFNVFNSAGINGNIRFEESVLCRGFTGTLQQVNPLTEAEFNEYKNSAVVYIFPKYGERFHKETCKYIKQNNSEGAYVLSMDREDAERKGYTPCMICQGAAYE